MQRHLTHKQFKALAAAIGMHLVLTVIALIVFLAIGLSAMVLLLPIMMV